ncbi:uncharacterized protein LOC108481143 [Gossypium arboreum]|uniref:uncharacterized protein LOC108481143 n=1 Tax=Gossypium arboreum TaxID=29729 RepID=UPI0008190175|nr:uncharacterized protein LOC108481143 [Gossypium arboreum]
MLRSQEESLEQRDQMAKMIVMMTALVKGKGPMQSPDTMEPQPITNHDQDLLYPPGFTPPHAHVMQRERPQGEPASVEQRPVPPIHLGQDKYRSLEERLKAIEGTEAFSALSAKELSLVPDLVLPPKLKVPDFKKYDGMRCPKAHLIMFCRKMTGYVNEDKLLIHCFQDSLMMEKKLTETFRQYGQRWRDISAQVEPPLTKTKLTVLFIYTLKAPFYDKLVGSATKDLADIVISRELIENAIKSGRMEGSESSKRVAPVKKNEAEAYIVGTENYYTSNPYLRFDGTSNTTGNLLPNHTEGNVSAVTEEDKWRTKSCVSEIKTHLQKIWKVMVENGLFCRPCRIFKEGSIKSQYFCDFHGIEGHDIQYCKEFRKLLQDMMDNKEIGIFNKKVDEGEVCASENQSSSFPYSAD